MFALKLALFTIISLFETNRFGVVSVGIGYIGPSEKPSFSITELTAAEFQDYKIIPPIKNYVSFAFFIAGAKLTPILLLNREDRTFEFIRELNFLPGGGLFPISVFIYSPRLIYTIYSGDRELNIIPNMKIQLIPISDLTLINIFNPLLFTKKILTPGPFPHFEIAPGVRGIAGGFDFELKFGLRTYAIIVPIMTQAEKEAIKKYQGVKKFVGNEYSQKYGFMFFANFSIGVNMPSYYVTQVVTREEKETVAVATESEELKKKISELEEKLAQLEKGKTVEGEEKELPEAVAEEKVEEKPPKPEEVVKITVVEVPEDYLASDVISIDGYKDGNLYISWKIPPIPDIKDVSFERCFGYNCENFSSLGSFSAQITSYTDQIVENQIYCYRLSINRVLDEKSAGRKGGRERVKTISTGKVCTYVSHKGELIRIYF